MKQKFEFIISALVCGRGDEAPLTGIDIAQQFRPDETATEHTSRNLNAAFLICLCGESHHQYSAARQFLKELGKRSEWHDTVEFFTNSLNLLFDELESRYKLDGKFRENVDALYDWISCEQKHTDPLETIDKVWEVFFPEGVSLFRNRYRAIDSLRKRRTIQITRINPSPIRDPAREIVFTSNILLTIPPAEIPDDRLSVSDRLKAALKKTKGEEQIYWYDHPIEIGADTEKNEILHGLMGLDQAAAFEKQHGKMNKEGRLPCLLSISVTHAGLHTIARQYLEELLQSREGLRHIQLYAFTEADTKRIVDEIIFPSANKYLGLDDASLFHEIIGVDGEYGRHYSFLRAVSALWQIFADPGIKATFKIDLDQVFEQERLLSETGASAFEHLKSPLWGAEGKDCNGEPIDLGMIAGALVNSEDIEKSIFTPDVQFPSEDIKGDDWIFLSSLPQALSTVAEMMTQYKKGSLDGSNQCIQRVHVTGGTCGILVKALRKYRPFTPCFIGRAEDQAYLLSVLFQQAESNLRYAHKDGLIMRHDKEAFASVSSVSTQIGKLIGDYVRILLFSYYARALPWAVERTKDFADPFTGCFISHIPLTVTLLRLTLKGASFFKSGRINEGYDLLKLGATRLHQVMDVFGKKGDRLNDRLKREKRAWDIYYDLLDELEKGIKAEEPFAISLREKALSLIKACEIFT